MKINYNNLVNVKVIIYIYHLLIQIQKYKQRWKRKSF